MELTVHRQPTVDDITFGTLAVNGVFFCHTLEDAIRDHKLLHETAIPAGTYTVIIDRSQRFQRMLPRLLNVPGFEGIRIHPGNTREDTSGCILVGDSRAAKSILASKVAFDRLMALLAPAYAKGEKITMTLLNPTAPSITST